VKFSVQDRHLYGAGAADMKSGLAIMIELCERLPRATLPVDLTLVFYEREEGPFAENVLGPMLEEFAELRSFDLAICLEPSDNRLQLGCMGSLHATVTPIRKVPVARTIKVANRGAMPRRVLMRPSPAG